MQQLTPPLAKAIAMIAAASITHESGFHINPKNFKNLLSCKIHNTRHKAKQRQFYQSNFIE
jgi:hypothetical protein